MKQKIMTGISLLLVIAFLYTGQQFVLSDAWAAKAKEMIIRTNTGSRDAEPTSATSAPETTADKATTAAATTATTAPAASTSATTAAPTSGALATDASTAAPTSGTPSTAQPRTQPPASETASATSAAPGTDPATQPPVTLFPPLQPPEKPQGTFRQAPPDYFKDALFIGDSRTEELMEYGDLPGATFFARVSMSLYNMHKKTCHVNNGIGDVSFDTLMANHKFKKVYIMLGVNEIDYDRATTVNKYKALIEEIQAAQPDAIIFIQANIHLTQKESDKSSTINNRALDDLNEKISRFADQKTVFYIDPNERFDDGHGAMRAECSGDGTHLKAKYTREWAEWLKTKAVLV